MAYPPTKFNEIKEFSLKFSKLIVVVECTVQRFKNNIQLKLCVYSSNESGGELVATKKPLQNESLLCKSAFTLRPKLANRHHPSPGIQIYVQSIDASVRKR